MKITISLDGAAEAALLRLARGRTMEATVRRALIAIDAIEARRSAQARQLVHPVVVRADEDEQMRVAAEGARSVLDALAAANDDELPKRPGLAKGRA
jgi:hypothetical protein